MRKLITILIMIFYVSIANSQVLLKNSFTLDAPGPSTKLGGNGISTLLVQEFSDSTIIWTGTSGGVSRLNAESEEWRTYNRRHGLGYGGVSAIAVDGDVIWAATVFDSTISDNDQQVGGGLAYSLDGGKNWKYIPQPGDTPVSNTTWDIIIDDSTVWTASFGGGLKKTSNWKTGEWLSQDFQPTWETISPDEYHFDPAEYLNHRVFSVSKVDDVLWVGSAGGINKSLDDGKTWVNFNHQNQEQPISGNWVLAIANQKYKDNDVLWLSTVETTSESEDASEFRGISKSEDQGYTWKTYLEGIRIENFAFDDSVVYACSQFGLYKSIDGGENWAFFPAIVDYESDTRVLSIEVYSAGVSANHVLWVGTGDGLAKTADNGLTWKIFRTFVPTGRSGEPRTYAYPNPFSPMRHNLLGHNNGYVRFQYNTKNSTNVTIRIFDFAMDLVTTVVEGKQRPGNGDFAEIWNGKTENGELLANGVYFYQLILDGDGTYWGKLMILD